MSVCITAAGTSGWQMTYDVPELILETEPGLQVIGSPGQWYRPGHVGSRVSVSDPVFDPALGLNMRVYRGIVSTK